MEKKEPPDNRVTVPISTLIEFVAQIQVLEGKVVALERNQINMLKMFSKWQADCEKDHRHSVKLQLSREK
jgi:hypothetical protein